MFNGCINESPTPEALIISKENLILYDSINKLDSLVNANKALDHPLCELYAKRAMSLAFQMNTEEALAKAFIITGRAFANHNNDSSFFFYTKALKIAEKYKLENIRPKLLYNLAMIYLEASDQKTAVVFLDSTINIANRNKDYGLLSNTYNALGNLKFDLMDTLDSKIMYDSAFTIATKNGLTKQTGIAIASLSKFESDEKKSSSMRKKAINILQKQPGNEVEIATILNNIGMRCSNTDTAIWYYKAAINIAKSAKYVEVEVAANNNLAYSLIDKKDFANAEACLVKNAIPLSEKDDNYLWLSNLFDSYTDVLVAEKKIDQALLNARLALQMRIKADQRQASNQVRLLAALLNVKSKELRIQTNEKELQGKENKIRLIIFFLSISLMALFLTILLYKWKIQRSKIAYQNSLFSAAKKLIDIEENMKGRVAMELHDLTSPFYTIMLQQIEKAKIGDSKIEYDLKRRLSVMTESIRQISHRMDNNFIGQISIAELVEGLCGDLQEGCVVPINFTIQKKVFDLTVEQTIHIYRIIQEILTNAIKYASSGDINLSISEEAGMFIILYRDCGPGFDTSNVKNTGLGITNIFERAKILNGKAILSTAAGDCTKWNIVIPNDEKK